MAERANLFCFLLSGVPILAGLLNPAAQSPGFAQIIAPASGEVVSGVVVIEGTADHPAFTSYDLAFSFDPNPTNTWFSIGDPVYTPVRERPLGLWDTTQITDGNYALRLQVWFDEERSLTVIVRDIRVRNDSSEPTPPTPTAATSLPAPTPGSTQQAPEAAPTSNAPPPDPVRSAFFTGVALSIGSLGIFGLYATLREPLRRRLGAMRMRRVHRPAPRRRGRR